MDRRGTIDRQCHWKISNADGSATANEVAVIAVARSPARFRAPGLGRAVSNTPMATVAPNFMLGHSWHRLNAVAKLPNNRLSGPPMNKLPSAGTEVVAIDSSCAAAQLWR